MAGNDNSQDPYDFDSLNAQPATGAGTGADDTNSWYYRQSSGMNDWAAQMGKASQGDNVNALNSADSQSLNDNYNKQKQATDQFGKNQPFTPGATSSIGDTPDFMVKQPLQLQQNTGNNLGNEDNTSLTGARSTSVQTSNPSQQLQTQPQIQPPLTPPTDADANVTAYGYGVDNKWHGHANGGATIAYTDDRNRPRDAEGNPQAHLGSGTYDDPGSMAKHPDNPLPMGSRVYVQGVGWFVIEDVSGRTRPNGTQIPVNSYDMWSGHSTVDQRNSVLANPNASITVYHPKGTTVPVADQMQGPSQTWTDFVHQMRQRHRDN